MTLNTTVLILKVVRRRMHLGFPARWSAPCWDKYGVLPSLVIHLNPDCLGPKSKYILVRAVGKNRTHYTTRYKRLLSELKHNSWDNSVCVAFLLIMNLENGT